MKAEHIILHLMENLPKYTDKFSSFVNPESISIAGDTISVGLTAHGLSTGNIIVVTDGAFLNTISNIDDSGDNVLMTTTNVHDLSVGWTTQVYLTSVTDNSIDGFYDIIDVPDRNNFEIESFPNTGLTDVVLHEVRSLGINGLFNVNVIDADNFEYTLEQDLGISMPISTDTKIHNKLRISGATTIERIIASYEQQESDNMFGFVVLGENAISKDRYVSSDADMEQGGSNEWNGLYLSPFSFYVFVPSQTKITGRLARDQVEDVRPAIFSSLLGAFFETGFTNEPDSKVTPQGDGIHAYSKAYYIHRFDFVQVAQIALEDTNYLNQTTVSWKSLQFDFLNIVTDNGEVIQSTVLDLDAKSD